MNSTTTLKNLYTLESMSPLFNLLETCKGVEQENEYHPEKDVFEHSLQVLKWAFRESNDIDLILSAMLHDIGKPINKLGHEEIAIELLHDYCSPKTLFLIEHHRRIWDYLDGTMQGLKKCIFLAYHPWLPELIQLARWDKKGRKPDVETEYNKEKIIDKLNKSAGRHFEKEINSDGNVI